MTYKFPKKHNIVDETKIYYLKAREEKDFIEVRVAFSIGSKSEYYKSFVELSQDYIPVSSLVFRKEDYELYEKEMETEEIDYFSSKYLEPIPDSTNFRWNPPPTAFSRLLPKGVKELVQYTDPVLSFDKELQLFFIKEFVINCATTRGILADLKDIKEGKELSHFAVESNLYHLIKALDSLWH